MSRRFITTAIPYVNGRPHVGHALELVETDVIARYRRENGDEVIAQTGTDDNAIKNVQSAAAEGVSTEEYVATVAERFAGLAAPLDLSFDDFIRTSSDPRHRPGVEKLWRLCADRGDFYRKSYSGLYCVGCELFYPESELIEGRCPEHGTVPELVEESNWFFRLSRYQDALEELIATDQLRVEPVSRKNEILTFVRSGLEDFSASRSFARARGWGIPVPDDDEQVIYVWFDALANYITAPGFGSDEESFDYWWTRADEVLHVIGKGIIRFHAVYWPAMLLSAGLRLPTTIYVHEYLTADGAKISKSAGNAEDPTDIVAQDGSMPLRWWMLSEVARAGDTDYTRDRMIARANLDLANNLGNLVNRTVSMVGRYRYGAVPTPPEECAAATALTAARREAPAAIATAIDTFDFRRAADAVTRVGDEGNRFVEATRPWVLAKAEKNDGASPAELDAVLAELVETCRDIGRLIRPLLPEAAEKIETQVGGATLGAAEPIFRRLET